MQVRELANILRSQGAMIQWQLSSPHRWRDRHPVAFATIIMVGAVWAGIGTLALCSVINR